MRSLPLGSDLGSRQQGVMRVSEQSAQAIADWLRSNLEETITARSTWTSGDKIRQSTEDDVSIVPTAEPKCGGQAAACRATVTVDGTQWPGEFAVRAELLESSWSREKREVAVSMAQIAASYRAGGVLLRPWRTAEAQVPARVVGSQRDGTETIGLDIMQWAEDFPVAFEGLSGQARVDRAIELAIPLFSGLDYIHEHHHVVHRDIHPSNVMVAGGRLVLVDWGIASTVTDGISTMTTAMGKRGSPYFAPEAAAGQRIGRFTDAWALGVLLCEMACGEPPVRVGGMTELQLPAAAGDLPRWLCAVITGLATVDPSDRMVLEDAVAALRAAGRNAVAAGAWGGATDSSAATTGPTAPDRDGSADRRARAKELLADGYAHSRVGRHNDALAAYASAVETCHGDPDPALRQCLAMALNNTQWALYQQRHYTEAVATCSRVVDTFKHDSNPLLRQQVAIAFNGSGYSKRALGLAEAAMADWDEVVAMFGNDPDLILRRHVAMALRDKGLALAEADRRVDALSAYTRLIESFEGDPDLVLRQQVAMALNNKRWCLYWLGHYAEAAAACTRLVETYGSDRDPMVRGQVMVALLSKGLILDRSRQREGALAAYGRLVDIFERDPDPSVQKSVEWARGRLRGGSSS